MVSDERLRQDIRSLGETLGEVIREQAGDAIYDHVEDIRALAKARRNGDENAEANLIKAIASLSTDEIRAVGRAFSIFFELANLAEDSQRVRVLREREQMHEPSPRGESIAAAIEKLQAAGLGANDVQNLLDRLTVELVFTAHPTEAKRRSLREKLRLIREALRDEDQPDYLQRERRRNAARIYAAITGIWEMDFLGPRRPTVLEEVDRGLAILNNIWHVVPDLYFDLEQALEQAYPDDTFHLPPVLRFGSWIGGDRDGNPFVTVDVTRTTLQMLRDFALRKHTEQCTRCVRWLTPSTRKVKFQQAFLDALSAAENQWPGAAEATKRYSEFEAYRRWLAVIRWRLEQTQKSQLFQPIPEGAYASPDQLMADLELLCNSLRSHKGERLIRGDLHDWMVQVRVFGFHAAALDVRQESSEYQAVVDDLLRRTGDQDKYIDLPEDQKQKALTDTMPCTQAFDDDDLSENVKETLDLYRLLAEAAHHYGSRALGCHIVSMTHQPSDVLTVLWLAEWAGAQVSPSTGQPLAVDGHAFHMPIVPLLETIEDLAHGAETLTSMLQNPAYAKVLKRQGNVQVVMIGYSDSTKDGGYLSACWSQYKSQAALHEVTERFGVELMLFHGRGGSLGRGGGPAAQAIMSQPPHTIEGRLRVTEQGEVLAERYDDPQVAYRHLEQMTWATILVTALDTSEAQESWQKAMSDIADRSLKAHRELVERPGFIQYFRQATPIRGIESLPIGSRPSRRKKTNSLKDLRAIPWVFSWTQCRQMIPAWYGLGTAIEQYINENEHGLDVLHAMYANWLFFRGTMHNAELALAKADMGIARLYANMVDDPEVRDDVWGRIEAEYHRSAAMLLKVTSHEALLDKIPWLKRSIDVRNPYIDPLNVMQVQLSTKIQQIADDDQSEEAEELRRLLRLSIQGIAAGMRTTG